MKYKSTLVLFIVVVVAGIVAYSLSRKPTSEELEQQRSKLLAGVEADDVQTLTVDKGDGRIVCRRDADDKDEWRITEPVDIRADRYAVEDVIRKLGSAERQARVSREGLKLADYGLAEPKRTVTLEGKQPGQKSWVIDVGGDAPAGNAVWVAVKDAPAVYSVTRDVAQQTDVTVAGLRSKNLGKRISTWDLQKLSVAAAAADDRPAYELACEKTDGKWEIKQPIYDPGDRNAIEAVVNKVYDQNIKADDVVADDMGQAAQYGLDKPDLTVTVAGKDRTEEFALSRRTEDGKTVCYAMQKGENPIVRVPESLFDALRKQPDELRDKSLVDFRVEDVTEIKAASPVGELVLAKVDEGWQITGDEAVAADADVIKTFLDDLKKAEVKEFAADGVEDLTPYGLAEGQRLDVVLSDEDGETLAHATFGLASGDGGRVYARRGDYPAVLTVERGPYLDKLERGGLAFLDRNVLKETQTDIAELQLVRGTEKFRCAWNRDQSRWDLLEPVSGEADTSACHLIASDFAALKAVAFAAERAEDLTPYGLDKPAITCTATIRPQPTDEEPKPAERVHTLRIGSETADPAQGRYARLDDDDRVFVLADSKAKHFEENLASKYICRSWSLRSVTFRKGDKELVVTYDRDADAWRDAEGNELAKDSADRMREARYLLGNFQAERLADYIVKSPALYGFDEPYLTVSFDDETAKGKNIIIGKEVEGGGRYAKGPASGFVQVARDEDVQKLADVIEPPAPPASAAAQPAHPIAEGAPEAGQAAAEPAVEATQPAAKPAPEATQPTTNPAPGAAEPSQKVQ
jgi:hypothetical protein